MSNENNAGIDLDKLFDSNPLAAALKLAIGTIAMANHDEATRIAEMARNDLARRASATPSSKHAGGEPVAWVYECAQPGTDGKVWAEFFGRDKPEPKDYLRNITPLYVGPMSAGAAAKTEQELCPHCGTHEIELSMTCHNSACSAYAASESIYKGWERPATQASSAGAGSGSEFPAPLQELHDIIEPYAHSIIKRGFSKEEQDKRLHAIRDYIESLFDRAAGAGSEQHRRKEENNG